MSMTRFRLTVLHSGLHSLHHGIYHLGEAIAGAEDEDARAYDPEQRAVRSRAAGGQSWFVGGPYIKLPRMYEIKFAILHLIQGLELILKDYLEREQPGSTSQGPGRSISMRTAARQLVKLRPGLLAPHHLELVLNAGTVRNTFEHAEIDTSWTTLRRTGLDFLAVANYLAFALHGIKLHEEFSFDPYSEGEDRVGDVVAELLSDRSPITEQMSSQLAAEWAAESPNERLVMCLQCGARGVRVTDDQCVSCGAFGDAEVGVMLDDLDELSERIQRLKARLPNK